MVINIGMVGFSEGNGHPFSFSAIINGYSNTKFVKAGWPIIYDYIRLKDCSEFGFDGVSVTHAWTQDPKLTEILCEACLIPYQVQHLEDMINEVDAVIIARDDYMYHLEIAMPFLKAGLPVFIDKPLTVCQKEFKHFLPFLRTGQLMSCSGMRYAVELDEVRSDIKTYGQLKLIRAAVVNDWEKYGIHMLDAVFSFINSNVISVQFVESSHPSLALQLESGTLLHIDALGEVPRTFRIDIWGTHKRSHHEISDNFTMFRRMLWHFIWSVRNGKPAIPVDETTRVILSLIAGRMALQEKRKVWINEFNS